MDDVKTFLPLVSLRRDISEQYLFPHNFKNCVEIRLPNALVR